MAMGKRKTEKQEALFIVAADLPRTPAHPFYEKLNQVLAEDGFDRVRRRAVPEVLCGRRWAGRQSGCRGSISGCCCWAISRGSTPSAASPGVAATRCVCGRSWAMRSARRPSITRRSRGRGG